MKRSLLVLSMVLCFSLANSQTNFPSRRNNSKDEGQKQMVNPNHIPTSFKLVNSKGPIPTGYARVSLTAGDFWGDGTGYQLLLDSDANTYGSIIPTTGALSDSGDVSSSVYGEFEYKIPVNADGSLNTTNIIMNNSISIDIPIGTYDWVVTNPSPGDRMWIVGTNGRSDDFVFANGIEYNFNITGNPQNGDIVVIQTVDPNLPSVSITWDFQDGIMPFGFVVYND